MDNMKIEFTFERTRFHLADLDCWALSQLGIPENELDQFYDGFLKQLLGVRYNIYVIAENIIDYFQIEPNIKRGGFTPIANEGRTHVMEVLNIKMGHDGLTVSLRPHYLDAIKERHLPRPISTRVFSRKGFITF